MANKKKRFWYHYNKPESKKQGRNVITVHWRDACHPVNKILCNVPTESHNQKRQPYCVIRGWCDDIIFVESNGVTTAAIK